MIRKDMTEKFIRAGNASMVGRTPWNKGAPWDEAVKEKLRKTATPGALKRIRGGNGTGMTAAETLLLTVLKTGWAHNYVVPTGLGSEGYPNHYKLDFAWPSERLCLEVDGSSHNSLQRQQQDARKTAFLEERGWTVFRVSNVKVKSMSTTSRWTDLPAILQEEY